MIFELILLVLLGAVAFFQYLQGFFSATISVIIALVAAVMAVSYHEMLASVLVSINFPAQAAAISLVVIFAAVYLLLRLAFDAMVPGNVRFPWLMDKIGAGVMGVILGLIGTGIIAIAAQMIPFPPSIAGYSRFALYNDPDRTMSLGDRTGRYMRRGQYQDSLMHYLTKTDSLDPADPDDVNHLWFRQDDMVIGLVNRLSDGGSMAGVQPLAAIHPDYLGELYGQRLGIQLGTKHTLVSTEGNQTVKAEGLCFDEELPQVDGEVAAMRQRETPLPKTLTPESGKKLLVVRVSFSNPKMIADNVDTLLRFSPASIRLLAVEQQPGDAEVHYQNYYPVATLDPRGVAVRHRIDDFLLSSLKESRTIDFVFVVDDDAFDSLKTAPKLRDGTFLEVKRYGRMDLSDKKVEAELPANPDADGLLYPWDVDEAIAARSGKAASSDQQQPTPTTPAGTPGPGPTPTPTPTPTNPQTNPQHQPEQGDPLGLGRKLHSIGIW